jgi:hypothetical protein
MRFYDPSQRPGVVPRNFYGRFMKVCHETSS